MSNSLTSTGNCTRCSWCGDDPLYVRYHDTEWGFPVHDDTRLFEKISLEGFQSGLSWLTILRKRGNFRRAFAGFDIGCIARFGARDVTCLLGDAGIVRHRAASCGIVRHRGKIESTINNARRCADLMDESGSLANYAWRFEPDGKARPKRLTWPVLRSMTTTPESHALSRDLKKRGWTFVGPTTMYAFMQVAGIVNDHLHGCDVRMQVELKRKERR